MLLEEAKNLPLKVLKEADFLNIKKVSEQTDIEGVYIQVITIEGEPTPKQFQSSELHFCFAKSTMNNYPFLRLDFTVKFRDIKDRVRLSSTNFEEINNINTPRNFPPGLQFLYASINDLDESDGQGTLTLTHRALHIRDEIHFKDIIQGCFRDFFYRSKNDTFKNLEMASSDDKHEENLLDFLQGAFNVGGQKALNLDQMIIKRADEGNINLVKYCIDNKADINSQDSEGDTALIKASKNGHLDVVKLLLKYQANPNVKNNLGGSALLMASHFGHKNIAMALLKHGANVDEAENEGFTPLLTAVHANHVDIVSLLIGNKANVNSKNSRGVTPLMIAAHGGNSMIIKLLIDNGANREETDNNGNSADDYASSKGNSLD